MRHGLDAHSCCHHGGDGGARVRRTRIRTSVRGTPICGAVGWSRRRHGLCYLHDRAEGDGDDQELCLLAGARHGEGRRRDRMDE
jgi:hypothetical protein